MIPTKVKYIDSEGWHAAMIYEATPNQVIPAEAVEAQPEPCEYCSMTVNALKVHDGSCDGMTEQEWRELRGEGVGHE